MRFINSIAVLALIGVAVDKIKDDRKYNNMINDMAEDAKQKEAFDIANAAIAKAQEASKAG